MSLDARQLDTDRTGRTSRRAMVMSSVTMLDAKIEVYRLVDVPS